MLYGAAVTLVAGVFIEGSGEELFGRLGMSGVLLGAIVLAVGIVGMAIIAG